MSTLRQDPPKNSASKDPRKTFDTLVRQHYTRLYNYARCLASCPALAEEITQEAFVRAYRFFHYYDPERPFMAWISRIAHNVFVDMRRARKVETVSLDTVEHQNWTATGREHNPEHLLMDVVLNERLEQALQSLSPRLRVTILLCDLYGWSYEEISQVMGCSPGTTRSRIHRARERLRMMLTSHGWSNARLLLSTA